MGYSRRRIVAGAVAPCCRVNEAKWRRRPTQGDVRRTCTTDSDAGPHLHQPVTMPKQLSKIAIVRAGYPHSGKASEKPVAGSEIDSRSAIVSRPRDWVFLRRFPRVWVPRPDNRDLRHCLASSPVGGERTRIMNPLQVRRTVTLRRPAPPFRLVDADKQGAHSASDNSATRVTHGRKGSQCEEEPEAVAPVCHARAIISRPRIAGRNFDRKMRNPIRAQNTQRTSGSG